MLSVMLLRRGIPSRRTRDRRTRSVSNSKPSVPSSQTLQRTNSCTRPSPASSATGGRWSPTITREHPGHMGGMSQAFRRLSRKASLLTGADKSFSPPSQELAGDSPRQAPAIVVPVGAAKTKVGLKFAPNGTSELTAPASAVLTRSRQPLVPLGPHEYHGDWDCKKPDGGFGKRALAPSGEPIP